ncbi:MAG TPA: RodZ domain-containing protein [Candidatus Aquicultor sp.]|jgi:cytoskeletal protein RodZ
MYKDLIGETLLEARTKLGKSIKEVEFDTKIRARYIESLENNDFTRLPADIYTQGFLKSYAVYLGLDPEPLIQQYKSLYAEPSYNDIIPVSPNMQLETKKRSVWATLGIGAGALAGIFVALLIWGAIAQNISKEPKVRVENIKTRKTIDTAVASATTSTTSKESAHSANGADSSTSTTDTTILNGDGKIDLKVKLTGVKGEGAWVTVTVDGKREFTGMVKIGVSKLFKADEAVSLKIGKPEALEVMVNGKKIPDKRVKTTMDLKAEDFKKGSSKSDPNSSSVSDKTTDTTSNTSDTTIDTTGDTTNGQR